MLTKFIRKITKRINSADRKTMEAALKRRFIPVLREQGFKGSFPNFYRSHDDFVALVNFQFFSSGGSFCVNLGYADPQRKNVVSTPEPEIQRLRVSSTKAHERHRLGAKGGEDSWFDFETTSYNGYIREAEPVDVIAEKCTLLFLAEAECWWQGKQKAQK